MLIASGLVLAATASGCSHPQVVGRERIFQLALTEYRVIPGSVRAKSGPLTILAHNYGRLTHNLAISRNGKVMAETKPLWPGASAVLTVALPAGRYAMGSTLFDDQALGEYGTLTVTS